MAAISFTGITLEDSMEGGLSAPWSTVLGGANEFKSFTGGSADGLGISNCMENGGDLGSVSEGRYDFQDAGADWDGDGTTTDRLIAITQRTRALIQRVKVGDVNVDGLQLRFHSVAPTTIDTITEGMSYAITGQDVRPINETYELLLFDLNATAASHSYRTETGTFDPSAVLEMSLICEQTGNNTFEMWSHLFVLDPIVMIGGDGGDTDGVFQDFFDYADGEICRCFVRPTPTAVFVKCIMVFGNSGTNDVVFADSGYDFEFANEPDTGKAIGTFNRPGYHHIRENVLGIRALMGADDDVELTNCTFNSIFKYKFLVTGSTNDTFKMVGGKIKFAGTFEVSPAATFDGTTVENNETMVFT